MTKHTLNSEAATNRMTTEDFERSSNPKTADLSALKINRPREKRRKSRKWLKVIPWILIPALIVTGYFILKEKLTQGTRVDTTTVRLVEGSSAKALLSASGYVVAQRYSSVASKATGRVVELRVGEGDKVIKGELIARVESDDVQASLDLSRANLAYAIADSIESAALYSRNLKLFQAGTNVTDELMDTYTARQMRSNATVLARRASLRSAEINLDNTNIRAPFDGTVIRKIAEIGDIVAPFASSASSAGAVVTLADMGSLEVEADVSESNIQKVKVNMPCEIVLDAYPDVRYEGYVKNIVPTARRASATIMNRIAFNELDSLIYPEMSARVYFMNPDKELLRIEEPSFIGVSKNAIVEKEDESYVFIVNGNAVEKRSIETGKTVGKTVEVLSGLEVDDEVVLTPPRSLEDGDKIKLPD
jgi:HlyD family secretion protein